MTPIEFMVSRSKVKVTVTFKLRGSIHVSQTFFVSDDTDLPMLLQSGQEINDKSKVGKQVINHHIELRKYITILYISLQ